MATQTRAPAAAQKAAPRPRSFLVGTQAVIEGGDFDKQYTISTNTQNADPWPLQATGWLRGLYILVTGTGVTVGTVTADGPFSIFYNIQLNDVNNEAIFGPFDGYTAFLTNKYGGYFHADDPSVAQQFSYTGGTTTNNINFVLYIPLEIVARDPIGPVASVNNTASLTVTWTLNTLASVFTTVTGTLVVRIRGNQDFYWEPRKTDALGNTVSPEPPAAGTTQYWTQGSVSGLGGTVNQPLITGLGYPFRTYLYLLRGSDTTRATGETNWPDPLIGLKFEANLLLSNIPKTLWASVMAKILAQNGAADARGAGTASGKENGVYAQFFNTDFFKRENGGETRRSYLVTSPGSNYIFNGAIGSTNNSLYSVVNYVAPGSGANKQDTRALTGGQ